MDRAQAVNIGSANRNQWWLVPGTAWKAACHAELSRMQPPAWTTATESQMHGAAD